jgi:8-oxo-dGTP diphosphatase
MVDDRTAGRDAGGLYDREVHMPAEPMIHAAGLLPVYPGGAVLLLLRDDRPDIAASNCWGLVGGHVEPGETPAVAVLRETAEEIGRRPDWIAPAGFHDHPSFLVPGARVRSHLFATAAMWSLDDLILGEGQRLDWFLPAEVPRLSLASALKPPILTFLASDLHRKLAGERPPQRPPLPGSLPDDLPALLGLRPGMLVELRGISAGFVRRLSDLPHGARVTASPGPTEQPDVILWQPRDVLPVEALVVWRDGITSGARLWVIVADADEQAAVGLARRAGLGIGARLALRDGHSLIGLERR